MKNTRANILFSAVLAFLFLLLFVMSPLTSLGQNDDELRRILAKVDEGKRRSDSIAEEQKWHGDSITEEWKRRADSITAGCLTSYEKAVAIYLWEVKNIEYDYSYEIHSAIDCWRMHKGVCQAYSELFVRLATNCGVEARTIRGQAKTNEYPNGDGPHAWVAARTNEGTILIDPTWGSGHICNCSDANQFQIMQWFDVKPECIIFTHLPDNAKDQYLSSPITEEQYRALPKLGPIMVKGGWDAAAVLSYFLKHPTEKVPIVWEHCDNHFECLQLIQAPYGRTLHVGSTYTLKIKCSKPDAVITSSEGKWVKKGNIFTLRFCPTNIGDFYVMFKEEASSFGEALFSYEVVDP